MEPERVELGGSYDLSGLEDGHTLRELDGFDRRPLRRNDVVPTRLVEALEAKNFNLFHRRKSRREFGEF